MIRDHKQIGDRKNLSSKNPPSNDISVNISDRIIKFNGFWLSDNRVNFVGKVIGDAR